MPGIVGVYHRDDRPAGSDLLRSMMHAIAHRGPDGSGEWASGPVALGHQMHWTTPEARAERQPLVSASGTWAMVADLRLDNRGALRHALGRDVGRARLRACPTAPGASADADETDAALVLAAYARWGAACLDRIVGDFALAIWDADTRRLFCARDPLGCKPFYYATAGDVFLFGSELPAVLANGLVGRTPNEGMIAEYLANAVTSLEETLFAGVRRLPPGHSLVVSRTQVAARRYWDPWPADIRYRADAEYAEHFRSLCADAVGARLRAYGGVGAHLSGGVDSSVVVALVQELVRDGAAEERGFETFSMRFPDIADADERPFIEAVIERWRLRGNQVRIGDAPAAVHVAHTRRYLDLPDFPSGEPHHGELLALARAKGFRVMLTGLGGDHWFHGTDLYYAELLRRGKLLALARRAWHDWRLDDLAWSPTELLTSGVGPLLPEAVKRRLRRPLVPAWMNADFARRVDLEGRLRAGLPPRPRGASLVLWFRRRSLYSAWDGWFHEALERTGARFGVEHRHPLHDRRLIEFALALPEDQCRRGGHTKFVVRAALERSLPAAVCWRKTKPGLDDLFPRAFTALGGGRLFESLEVARRGWVDGERVAGMYRALEEQAPRGFSIYNYPLWLIFGTDYWFRTVILRADRARPIGAPGSYAHGRGTRPAVEWGAGVGS